MMGAVSLVYITQRFDNIISESDDERFSKTTKICNALSMNKPQA